MYVYIYVLKIPLSLYINPWDDQRNNLKLKWKASVYFYFTQLTVKVEFWSTNHSLRLIWSRSASFWTSILIPAYNIPERSTLIPDVNTLRPRQNGRNFADDIFKCIFLNENVWISIKISLKFVPKGPINNIPALVQIMAWRRPGDKPLSQPMLVSLPTHICVTRPQWVKQLCAIRYVHYAIFCSCYINISVDCMGLEHSYDCLVPTQYPDGYVIKRVLLVC